MKPSLQAGVFLASIYLSSCVIAVDKGELDKNEGYALEAAATAQEDAGSPQADASASDSAASAPKKDKKKVDMAGLRIEFALAQMDMREAEGAVARSIESADHGIALAEHELELAQSELAHFVEVDIKLSAAEAELSLDRTRGRLDDSRAELQQLLDMYKDEEFAMSTKELVISRGKRSVEQSERSLDLAEKRAADQRDFEEARKVQSFQHKVEEAVRSLRLKISALETANAEGEAKLMRAQDKIRLVQKKIDESAEEAN